MVKNEVRWLLSTDQSESVHRPHFSSSTHVRVRSKKMPNLSKRKRQINKAKEAKRSKLDPVEDSDTSILETSIENNSDFGQNSSTDTDTGSLFSHSQTSHSQALIGDDRNNQSGEPHVHVDIKLQMQEFAQAWISDLDKDELMALTVVLYHCLMSELNMQLTQAAAIISSVIGKIRMHSTRVEKHF